MRVSLNLAVSVSNSYCVYPLTAWRRRNTDSYGVAGIEGATFRVVWVTAEPLFIPPAWFPFPRTEEAVGKVSTDSIGLIYGIWISS